MQWTSSILLRGGFIRISWTVGGEERTWMRMTVIDAGYSFHASQSHKIMSFLNSSLFTSVCYELGNNFGVALLRMYPHSWLLSQLLLLKKNSEGGQKEWPWKIAQWIKVFASEAWGPELGSPRVHTKGEQAWQLLGSLCWGNRCRDLEGEPSS